MHVAVLHVELFIPHALSLKDKRMVLRRVKDRLGKFNVAVAEIEQQDLWQRAALGVAVVSGERRQVGEMLQSVRRLVEGTFGAELLDWQEQLQ